MQRFTSHQRLGVTVFLVYLLCSSWRFPLGGDGAATLATARSLLVHHTLAIDSAFASDDGYAPRAKIGIDGRAYGKAGIGLPIVEMPFVAVALGLSRIRPLQEPQAIAVVLSLMNPLLMACTVVVVLRLCQSIDCPTAAARSIAAMFSLGTLAWVYAGVDGTEPLQALCLAIALLCLIRDNARVSARGLAISSIALTFAVITKPANAVLVPAFAGYVGLTLRGHHLTLLKALRRLSYFIAPLAAGVVFLLWLNSIRFGSVFETGYEHNAFRNPFGRGIYGLTLSFNKGIVFYSPLVLLAPFGVWMMRTGHRREAALTVVASLSYVLLLAKYDMWGAGWAFGPRYLVPLLPLLMLPVARTFTAGRRWRCAALILFAGGLVVNGVGVLVDGDAFHGTLLAIDLSKETGYVQFGAVSDPRQLVDKPVAPEDVLPQFSEIAGKMWLAHVAFDGCRCDAHTAECACRGEPMENNSTFLSPPWAARYPDARPQPPYGSRLLNPWLADRIHTWLTTG